MRVDAAGIREPRAVSRAERKPATVEGAADERIEAILSEDGKAAVNAL